MYFILKLIDIYQKNLCEIYSIFFYKLIIIRYDFYELIVQRIDLNQYHIQSMMFF